MLLKSKQPSIRIKNNGKVKFDYTFENLPVEVAKEHYEIIKKDYPNLFEEIKEVKK